jgi:hypothetical protein
MSEEKLENEKHIFQDIRAILENSGNVLTNIRELLGAIFIQEQRNYDMLVMIADKLGADTDKMINLHEQGSVLAPAPSFIFENDENEAE